MGSPLRPSPKKLGFSRILFSIDSKLFGEQRPTLIAAEIGQSHEGSLGTAFALVDAIAAAGGNAAKFQIHFANEESSSEDVFRTNFSLQDETRLDYWRRMEFTEDQWAKILLHSKKKGLTVICSVFSQRSLDLAQKLPVDGIKISSGEFFNRPLIDGIVKLGIPILISTGMSSLEECDRVIKDLSSRVRSLAILQCTSEYPTPLDRVGLNVLDQFADRYDCAIGLSDHSGTIHPGIYAIAKNLAVVEVHVTFSRDQFGPDITSSLTFDELKSLAAFNLALHEMKANPVDKDQISADLKMMRSLFTRSVGLRESMSAGSILRRESLIGRKPGTGIPWEKVNSVVGRRLKNNVSSLSLLRWEDLESGKDAP